MNRQFASYATGTAFLLELTKAQIRALIGIAAPAGSMQELTNLYVYKSIGSLLYKGLIYRANEDYALTKAGELAVKLLDEAGLVPKNRKRVSFKGLHEELKSGSIPEKRRGGGRGEGRSKATLAFDRETLRIGDD